MYGMDGNAHKTSRLDTLLALLNHALRYAVPGAALFQSVPRLARFCSIAIKSFYCLISHTINKRFITSDPGIVTHARPLARRMRAPLQRQCHCQGRPANLHSYSIADQTP